MAYIFKSSHGTLPLYQISFPSILLNSDMGCEQKWLPRAYTDSEKQGPNLVK